MLVAALTLAFAAQTPAAAPLAAPPATVIAAVSPPPRAAPKALDEPTATASDAPSREDKVSCRYLPPEGTMIGSYKECHTAKVWSRMAHAQ